MKSGGPESNRRPLAYEANCLYASAVGCGVFPKSLKSPSKSLGRISVSNALPLSYRHSRTGQDSNL
jgi:hypothetical protein